MEDELEYLKNLKQKISDTCNLGFIAQDFHRTSSLSHIIDRIELVEEAINDYQRIYK